MNWYANRVRRRILDELRSTFNMIDVSPGPGMFNHRCFENVVQYIFERPDKKLSIHEVIMIDEDDPILHYVVYDHVNEIYLDVTLGWRAGHHEYYYHKPIPKEDHKHIRREFRRTLDFWLNKYVPWWAQVLFGIERVL